ncbi:MAG: methionyl-tRNA formyltransferase [Chlamydiota bacterium]|nr:methionyl-tRNA formyltransferase [Chlamydiota bacterium]
MKIIFFGTPQIALKSLQALVHAGLTIQAVVTRPDRPQGRGLQMGAPPVKEFAQELGIEVIQPQKKSDPELIDRIRELKPDLIVCVAYGAFLVKEILEVPALGAINVHPSLLPKYRGASPVQWAVMCGEKETGVSIFHIGDGMDDGDVVLQEKVLIDPEENAEELFERLIPVGVRLLLSAVRLIEEGTAVRVKQQNDAATFAPKMTKKDGLINWHLSGREIANRIRGLHPWPIAYTIIPLCGENRELRIFKAQWIREIPMHEAGTVLEASPQQLRIACSDGVILPLEVQLDSKKRMPIADFLRGTSIPEKTLLISG